jgi:hypothetical protein
MPGDNHFRARSFSGSVEPRRTIKLLDWNIDLAQRDGSRSACRQASRYVLLFLTGVETCFGRSSGLSTVGGHFSGGNLTHGIVHLRDYWDIRKSGNDNTCKTKAARTLAWNSSIESWETGAQGDGFDSG